MYAVGVQVPGEGVRAHPHVAAIRGEREVVVLAGSGTTFAGQNFISCGAIPVWLTLTLTLTLTLPHNDRLRSGL